MGKSLCQQKQTSTEKSKSYAWKKSGIHFATKTQPQFAVHTWVWVTRSDKTTRQFSYLGDRQILISKWIVGKWITLASTESVANGVNNEPPRNPWRDLTPPSILPYIWEAPLKRRLRSAHSEASVWWHSRLHQRGNRTSACLGWVVIHQDLHGVIRSDCPVLDIPVGTVSLPVVCVCTAPKAMRKSLNAEAGGRIDRERAQRQLLGDNWPELGLVVWGDLWLLSARLVMKTLNLRCSRQERRLFFKELDDLIKLGKWDEHLTVSIEIVLCKVLWGYYKKWLTETKCA